MPGDLRTASAIISLSPLSSADRRDLCDTRDKWSLARNQTVANGNKIHFFAQGYGQQVIQNFNMEYTVFK